MQYTDISVQWKQTRFTDNEPSVQVRNEWPFVRTWQLIQCIKLCVYSHKHAVKTQQISKIVSLYHK